MNCYNYNRPLIDAGWLRVPENVRGTPVISLSRSVLFYKQVCVCLGYFFFSSPRSALRILLLAGCERKVNALRPELNRAKLSSSDL